MSNNEMMTRTLPAGYLAQAVTTAVYSPQWAVLYPALGLGNEVGELVEKFEAGAPAEELLAELGDVLWYVAALARDCRIAEDGLLWEQRPAPQYASASILHLVMAAGAAQGHIKKALRDHEGNLDTRRAGVLVELTALLTAADDIAVYLGSTIEDVCAANLAKLAGRAARHTLQGDGDVR